MAKTFTPSYKRVRSSFRNISYVAILICLLGVAASIFFMNNRTGFISHLGGIIGILLVVIAGLLVSTSWQGYEDYIERHENWKKNYAHFRVTFWKERAITLSVIAMFAAFVVPFLFLKDIASAICLGIVLAAIVAYVSYLIFVNAYRNGVKDKSLWVPKAERMKLGYSVKKTKKVIKTSVLVAVILLVITILWQVKREDVIQDALTFDTMEDFEKWAGEQGTSLSSYALYNDKEELLAYFGRALLINGTTPTGVTYDRVNADYTDISFTFNDAGKDFLLLGVMVALWVALLTVTVVKYRGAMHLPKKAA